MAVTAFISYSFHKKDKPVVDFFTDLIKGCGYKISTAAKEDSPFILGKIYPKIDKADIVIAIFSARNKISSRGNVKKFTPPSAVIGETGYATGKSKPVYGFCEDGIDINELGIIPLGGVNFPKFNKKTLSKKRDIYKEYLCKLPEIKKPFSGTFEFAKYAKDVTIYTTGYGVMRFRCRVKTKKTKFRATTHFLGLGESAKKNQYLPSFEVLNNGDPSYRQKQKPFFTYRLIEADFDESEVKPECLSEDKENIEFNFSFPEIPRGNEFTYEWAWGSPGLFPVRKEDLAPGKRKSNLDYVYSSLPSIITSYKDFNLILRFEGRPNFIKEPQIIVFDGIDGSGTPIDSGKFESQLSSLYTIFVGKRPVDPLQGGSIQAQWIPQ